MWFSKSRRAMSADDYETWIEGGLCPTLNVFDNNGDTRATVLITPIGFSHTQGLDPQVSTERFLTLRREGNGQAVATSTVVRRLTPTECERLQGFPDGWTAHRHDWKTGQTIEQKDSTRYRQMGNAVAVPCAQWLLQRLVTSLRQESDPQPHNEHATAQTEPPN